MKTIDMILRFDMVTTMEKVLNLHLSCLHEYESLYNQFLTYFQIAKQFQNIFDDYSNFIGVPLLWILVSDMNIIIQIINMIKMNITIYHINIFNIRMINTTMVLIENALPRPKVKSPLFSAG